MGKAILVINMPCSCADCDIRFTDEYTDWRPVNIEENQTDVFDCANNFTKPDWCPLKALPEKQVRDYPEYDKYITGYDDGWDACIDEILGE